MASRLLAVANVTGFLSGSAIFNPKNPIFIQLNPKFDRKLNLWSFYNLNIIYVWILRTFYTFNIQFYKFYHQIRLLTLILKFTWTTTKLHAKFNFRIIPLKIRESLQENWCFATHNLRQWGHNRRNVFIFWFLQLSIRRFMQGSQHFAL